MSVSVDPFATAEGRTEIAQGIAKSLMFFALRPPPGADANDFYDDLEVCFFRRIAQMLNEAANVRT